jgi:hypothetical protein
MEQWKPARLSRAENANVAPDPDDGLCGPDVIATTGDAGG